PPLNLDAEEALAVMIALAAMPPAPFTAAGRRARQKLLAVMRPDDAEAARRIAGRLRLRSGEPVTYDPAVLATVEDAVRHRRVARLAYTDADDATTDRLVEVHGLHLNADDAYLVGWCRL